MPLQVIDRLIGVKGEFIAFHLWEDAPDKGQYSEIPLEFLRSKHRHVFKVAVRYQVGDGDRELEFFDMQALLKIVLSKLEGGTYTYSCEQFAELIGYELDEIGPAPFSVTVSEDDENLALVIFYQPREDDDD
jgi:hypothetical protein